MEVFLFLVVVLFCLACSDLVVGVSNDAVNFLNSSIGSKVAPRVVIMIIASLGILVGVTFSSGMMEVARKGIFQPQHFYLPEIMAIFLAVMLTDILLLDVFNTYGFPTSTTVSIVFALLGAAISVAVIKVYLVKNNNNLAVYEFINTVKALTIISGILLSVIVAFFFGALFQFISRLIFTFDYKKRLTRYGAIWGGIGLVAICNFMLIKGAKGASFIPHDTLNWLMANKWIIMLALFVVFALILQLLLLFTSVNILKPIVLIGTFALAMAFAANDLVNFIGVPLAGMHSYLAALTHPNPNQMTMGVLGSQVPSNTLLLLAAGAIMVATLWVSKKARTVIKTQINLGRQDEGIEHFGSFALSRVIVRTVSSLFGFVNFLIPHKMREFVSSRIDIEQYKRIAKEENYPSFDLLRAAVNLMVASAIISFATSLKLPLSTTYVTFMVAMGTSLSDKAWGRESAVYRVTGVLTVIGGWFITAFMAFTIAGLFAFIIYFAKIPGLIILLGLIGFSIWKNHHRHKEREDEKKETDVFILRKIKDDAFAIQMSFEHSGLFLKEINKLLKACFNGLFNEDRILLKKSRSKSKKIQLWSNIIVANIFKTLRLLHDKDYKTSQKYSQIIGSLQEIAESYRDIVVRSYTHVANHHKRMLDVQVEELGQIGDLVFEQLHKTSEMLLNKKVANYKSILEINKKLKKLIDVLDKKQINRIQNDISKTRLSILFYGYLGTAQKISDNTLNMLRLFEESFKNQSSTREKTGPQVKTVVKKSKK